MIPDSGKWKWKWEMESGNGNGNGNDDVNMWGIRMGNAIHKWKWE